MKSNLEFDKFYDQELKHLIEDLEQRRLAINKRFSFRKYGRNILILLAVSVALIIINSVASVPLPMDGAIGMPITMFYIVIAPIYIFIRRNLSFSPLNDEYKQTVIPKILKFFSSDLQYNPSQGITQREFSASGLFDRATGYSAEDLVEGTIDGIPIRFSDVTATKRRSRLKNQSKNESQIVTLFHGMYAISTIQKNFTSKVIILPTTGVANSINTIARTFLGDQITDSLLEKAFPNIYKTEDPAFDNAFIVRCVDKSVASSLLTPETLRLIITFQQEMQLPVYVSLFDNQVHIGVSDINLFDGDAHTSFIKKDLTKQYFNVINLVLGFSQVINMK